MNHSSRGPRCLLGALVLLAGVAVGAGLRAAPQVQPTAPARNFTLPLFSPEGHRTLLLRGGSAEVKSRDRIDLTDVHVSIFSGDAAARLDTVLLSPAAIAERNAELIHGPSSIRLIRDDLEVTGSDWSYEHAAKRVLIRRSARVVFRAELPDLLP